MGTTLPCQAAKPSGDRQQLKKSARCLSENDGCGNMQAGVPVRVRKPKDKSTRWPRAWPASVQLPDECCGGDLVEVLETLQACHLTPTLPCHT